MRDRIQTSYLCVRTDVGLTVVALAAMFVCMYAVWLVVGWLVLVVTTVAVSVRLLLREGAARSSDLSVDRIRAYSLEPPSLQEWTRLGFRLFVCVLPIGGVLLLRTPTLVGPSGVQAAQAEAAISPPATAPTLPQATTTPRSHDRRFSRRS